ncbi:MAG: hypothetical protein PHO56_05140 [Patescibacteria group bacterium]|nr:hypothetical protein [Patescibacteria group bacterium]
MEQSQEEKDLIEKEKAGTLIPNEANRLSFLRSLRDYEENRNRHGLGSQMPGAEPGTIVSYDFGLFRAD